MNPLPLPESLQKGASPSAPLPMRLLLARAELPLSFPDKLAVLATLESDPEEEVREAVAASWKKMETEYLLKALRDSGLSPALLDLVAARFHTEVSVVSAVLAHQNAGPETLERFVNSTEAAVLDRLAANQRLLVEHPEIARKLLHNPALERSVEGRLRSLTGIFKAEEEELIPFESQGDAAPEELLPGFDGEIPEEFSQEIPEELLEDVEEAEPVNLATVNESSNIYKVIQGLSIAEKIKLATLGSKSARRLLARDSNRLVVTAVIRSPKIREDEIVPMAQDRTTPDDVLVFIMTRKEWMKNYQIRLALCKNPKTPLPKSLRLLETINAKDLRTLAKSRNIPSAVSTAALRILNRKANH